MVNYMVNKGYSIDVVQHGHLWLIRVFDMVHHGYVYFCLQHFSTETTEKRPSRRHDPGTGKSKVLSLIR